MKRTPTAEQKQAAAERRQKFRALVARIAKMTDAERAQITQGLATTIDGHVLSFKNQLLIALQLPRATVVGGFRQWIKAGRMVQKGQHGATIWIPTGKKDADGTSEPSDAEAEDAGGPRFLTASVFDISQTAPFDAGQDDTDEPEAVTLSA
jgi:hypothetical protein